MVTQAVKIDQALDMALAHVEERTGVSRSLAMRAAMKLGLRQLPLKDLTPGKLRQIDEDFGLPSPAASYTPKTSE